MDTSVRYYSSSRKAAVNVRKINPKVPTQQAYSIAQSLHGIIKQHGPLTISNTWIHAKVIPHCFFLLIFFLYFLIRVKQIIDKRGFGRQILDGNRMFVNRPKNRNSYAFWLSFLLIDMTPCRFWCWISVMSNIHANCCILKVLNSIRKFVNSQ